MHSALHPPNNSLLSDGVISHVVVRSRPPAHDVFCSGNQRLSHQFSVTLQLPALGRLSKTKRSRTMLSMADLTGSTLLTEPQQSADEKPQSDIELRRARNRIHQARHKMRQQQKVVDLEDSIQKLRGEIQQLEVQRQIIASGVIEKKTVWNVAAEYFRLFRRGVRSTTLMWPHQTDVTVQRNFLLTMMAPDVTYNTGCGAEAVLEDWRLMTLYHDDIDVQLVRMENGADGALVATSRGRITITEHTIRLAFPNLLSEDGGELSPLARELLGQQLLVVGSSSFYWSNAKSCVVSFAPKVDIMTPMLKLLGNLEDVVCVFDKSLLTPDFELVETKTL